MSTYRPERIAEIKAEMDRDKMSVARKASELGIPTGTLAGALFRLRKRTQKKIKPKVEIIDLKAAKPRLTMLDRIALMEEQLNAIRETLRSIQ